MPTALRRFVRFAVVGVLATAVHTAVFTVAIELAHVEAVLANAIAFSVAVLVGYALNRRWTFATHGATHARLWRYVIAQLIGLAWNSVIMFATVHGAHWSPYLTEGSSGITYVVDRFKGWAHSGHVTLQRGERSRLADHAAEIL